MYTFETHEKQVKQNHVYSTKNLQDWLISSFFTKVRSKYGAANL